MCKYGEIPIGYATGTVDITIPLYTLKCGELELPISLSYHGGGIKVDENASFVGLGWTLNAGGSIGVNVVGSNDSYTGTNFEIPSYQDMRQTYDVKCPYDIGELTAMSRMDLQPDIHSYNFCGYSGQFVFDMQERKFYDISGNKTVNWRTFSDKSYTRNLLAAKDNRGNDYVFSVFETCVTSISGHSRNLTTAWHLTKMKSVNLYDSILIDYETYKETERIRQATSLVFGINKEDWETGVLVNAEKRIVLGSAHPYATGYRDYWTKKIKRINASNGARVTFDYSECREDLYGKDESAKAALLEAITVYDMDGKRIRKWTFDYGYFRSYISSDDDETANCRLKLISLNEYGEDNSTCLPYKFNYYGEAEDEPQMPYKYSYAGKDAWGYCNGRPEKLDADDYLKAFPNFSGYSFYRIKQRKDHWTDFENMCTKYEKPILAAYTQGENKNANGLYVHAYALKKITYPTGGYSRFVYELNQFTTLDNATGKNDGAVLVGGFGPGVRIKEIFTSCNGYDETKRSFHYSIGELMSRPHFIKRRIYQYNAYRPYEMIYPSGSTYHYEDRTESPEVISYLEMFSSPCNVSAISGANSIGYPRVTECLPNGNRNEYDFAPLYLDFNNDNMMEKGMPFAGFNGFVGILEDDLEFPLYQYVDQEAKDEYATFNSTGYGQMNQITDERYFDFDGYCGTFFYRGMPICLRMFDSNGNIASMTEYSYDVKTLHLVPSMEVKPHINWQGFSNPAYSFRVSHIVVGEAQLANKKTFTYSGTNSVKEEERYGYNDNGLLVWKAFCNSAGDTIMEKTTYPNDMAYGEVYKKMTERNMLSFPIENIVYNNSAVTKSTLTTYFEWENSIYPWSIYCYRPNKPDLHFVAFCGKTLGCYGLPELTINEYVHGRICNYTLKDGIERSYMWGYNWEYPVVEVTGISYHEFVAALKPKYLSGKIKLGENDMLDLFSVLRKWNARIFAYHPQIGTYKSTSLNGGLNEYHYDNFGRLASVYRGTLFTGQELREQYTYHLKTK